MSQKVCKRCGKAFEFEYSPYDRYKSHLSYWQKDDDCCDWCTSKRVEIRKNANIMPHQAYSLHKINPSERICVFAGLKEWAVREAHKLILVNSMSHLILSACHSNFAQKL